MLKKKIILVTYGGGHVNMMVPVIKELQKNHHLDLLVLGLTCAGWMLEKNNIPHVGFKALMKPNDTRARMWGKRLADSANSHPLVPYDESVAYMGLSYRDLELRHGVDEASDIYKTQGGRHVFYPLTVMERFLKSEQPDLVVATNSPRAEKAAIVAAGNLNIKSLCLVDLFAMNEIEWIGRPGFADKICVVSDFVKQKFILVGRKEEEVVVAGNPAFDGMRKLRDPEVRKKYRKNKGWSDDEIVVLFLSHVEPERHPYSQKMGDPLLPRKVEGCLFKLVKANPKMKVVLRAHPNEKIIHGELPDNVERSTIHEDDFGDLLISSDCVIVSCSTGGYQAALIGKPLVNVKLSIFSDSMPYDKMGMSAGVDDLALLNQAVLKALSDGQTVKGLPEMGGATDNVVKVIEELLCMR